MTRWSELKTDENMRVEFNSFQLEFSAGRRMKEGLIKFEKENTVLKAENRLLVQINEQLSSSNKSLQLALSLLSSKPESLRIATPIENVPEVCSRILDDTRGTENVPPVTGIDVVYVAEEDVGIYDGEPASPMRKDSVENIDAVPVSLSMNENTERIAAEPASLTRKEDEIYVGKWIKFDAYEAALSGGKDTLVARDLSIAVFGEQLKNYNYTGKAAHNSKEKNFPPRKAIPDEVKRGIKAALTVWYQRRNFVAAVIEQKLNDSNAAWKRAITQKAIDMVNASDPHKITRKKLLRAQRIEELSQK